MQSTRNNPPQSSENASAADDEVDAARQPNRPSQSLDDFNQPILEQAPWQAAFRLAPNVRFTRTPENVLSRKQPEPAPAPAAVQPPPQAPVQAARPPMPGVVRPPVIQPQSLAATPVHAHDRHPVAPVDQIAGLQRLAEAMRQNLPQNLPKASQPGVIKPTPPGVYRPKPIVEAPAMAAPRQDIAISDFAFWDAMPFELEEPVVVAIHPAPAVQAAPQPGAPVTDLYREVPRRIASRTVVVAPSPRPEQARAPIQVVEPVRPAAVVNTVAPAPLAAPVAPAIANHPQIVVESESMDDFIKSVGNPAFKNGVVKVPQPPRPAAPAPVIAAVPVPAPVTVPTPVAVPAPVARSIQIVVPQPEPVRPRTVRPPVAEYEFPPITLLQEPQGERGQAMQPDALQQSAGLLESILEDFGVRGEIIDVRPGPVVTLYEFEPAPGVKSSRVIGLSDDIARSMSALSARVAVVPGRNVIGIELPNLTRETVFFRELIECEDYWETKHRLALCLGKTIGGEPVIAELAKMPHLLVAGTTGSGKSVAINTMILSLLYRLRPEECRLIMIDPKMLELSVYDGIPHLLTPVVTDPKKAVLALKWAVREMEDRYRKMSRLGVRNIDGYNQRAAQAREKGEVITVSVQSGFDRSTGEINYEEQELDLSPMPYIVVIVDEMADLMMVAGKEIEGAIQRLAQMARAAGIHLIMATQRPSVDVITGTIKANFPTRISFQVTSKIDSRTILGEQGAEHLLGQGDMLHMAGGGRISRVHGPFVSDAEVESVVRHLKTQGRPDYLGTVTEDEGDDEDEDNAPQDAAVFDKTGMGGDDTDELYDKAVKVVMKDRKCSTSYIQRRLSVGYNRAASLVERMEQEGLVGPANHVGKREIISGGRSGGSQDGFEE